MPKLTPGIAVLALALTATGARAEEFRCPDGTKEAGVGQEKQARWCETMVDGKILLDGPFWRFYPDGKIASKETFSRGDAVGTFQAWHPNGKLARKGSYKKGLAVGTWKTWDESGRLHSEIAYKLPRATRTEFFPDGKKRARGDLLDGAKVGTWTLWGADGKVVGTCDFGTGRSALPPGEACRVIAEAVDPKGYARPVARATVAEGGSFVVRVGDEAWSLQAPGGWVADDKAGAADGLPVILYPRGTGAWKGPATLYVRQAFRDGKEFRAAVSAEGDAFQKKVVDYVEKVVADGKTASGRPWIVKSLAYRSAQDAVGGAQIVNDVMAHEYVAFVDASNDVVLLLVLASPSEKQVDLALPALKELASSVKAAPAPAK